jgi:photosystem I P700 chlorophyll a apoprotein A2
MDCRNLFHVACKDFEKWVTNPLKLNQSHTIWDPFGESALKAFSKGNTYPVNIAFSGVYNGGIGFQKTKLYLSSIGLLLLSSALLFAGWLHLQPKFRSLSWFKNNESRLNHHLSGLVLDSLAWTGHLVHVAIPASCSYWLG